MEFQRSRDDNKLTRVMAQLKELAARKMLVLQQVAENGERAKDQLQQRIAELGLIRDQVRLKLVILIILKNKKKIFCVAN